MTQTKSEEQTKPLKEKGYIYQSINNENGMVGLQTIMFLVIAGLFLVLGAVGITDKGLIKNQESRTDTDTAITELSAYFSDFVEANGRLPCPARMDLLPNNPNFGREAGPQGDCANGDLATSAVNNGLVVTTNPNRGNRRVIMGALPNRVLNIPDTMSTDGYDQPILYVVTESSTNLTSYNVQAGAIEIVNEDHIHITQEPGSALYALISAGDGGGAQGAAVTASLLTHFSSCDTATTATIPDPYGAAGATIDVLDGDSENCDGNPVFKDSDWSKQRATNYYDDYIAFSEYEPQNTSPFALCGAKGMVYARKHPNADSMGCLDIALVSETLNLTFDTSPTIVNCPAPAGRDFCTDDGTVSGTDPDGWFFVSELESGEYIFTWQGNMEFQSPKSGQYAVVELKMEEFSDANSDGVNDITIPRFITADSHPIDFDSVNCIPGPQCPLEPFNGTHVMRASYGTKLFARIKMRHIAGSTSTARFMSPGEAVASAASKNAFHIVANRRVGTAEGGQLVLSARSTSTALPSGSVSDPCNGVNPPAACEAGITKISLIDKEAQIIRGDGTIDIVQGDVRLSPGDTIRSKDNTALELVFLDGSTILLASNTSLRIDAYIYNPTTPAIDDKAEYTLLEGVILYASGLMDKIGGTGADKSNVIINTDYGSAGVRGTVIMMAHDDKYTTISKIDDNTFPGAINPGLAPSIRMAPEGESIAYIFANSQSNAFGANAEALKETMSWAKLKPGKDNVYDKDLKQNYKKFCKYTFNKISSKQSKEAFIAYIDSLDNNHIDHHVVSFYEGGRALSIQDIVTDKDYKCEIEAGGKNKKKKKGD